MSTAAQMKQLAAPLLARHADLVMIGRDIVVKPVKHILRVIRLESALNKELFKPLLGVTHLFYDSKHLGYAWYDYITRPPGSLWSLTSPGVQDILLRKIEEETLPRLRAIETFNDFLVFTGTLPFYQKPWHFNDFNRLVISAALGDLEEARATCAKLAREIPIHPQERKDHLRITDAICPLLAADDRAGIARLLHTWEAARVKLFKLEKHWQPTPFPIEQQG